MGSSVTCSAAEPSSSPRLSFSLPVAPWPGWPSPHTSSSGSGWCRGLAAAASSPRRWRLSGRRSRRRPCPGRT